MTTWTGRTSRDRDRHGGKAAGGQQSRRSSGTSAPASVMPDDPVTVALEGLRRSVLQVEAAVDEERAKAMAERLNNPGHGAVDFGQPILTLGHLKDKIGSTMHNTVNDWIDKAEVGVPQLVLPKLFHECQEVVEARFKVVQSVLFPTGGRGVDEKMMRDHMLNNHAELFRLAPSKEEERERDIRGILQKVGDCLHNNSSLSREDARRMLEESGLGAVAAKYCEIIVHVYLQEPRASFSRDCGKHQRFAAAFHSRPVDGDSITEGEFCLVVFPAMMVGEARWSSNFTLGLAELENDSTTAVMDGPSANQAGNPSSSAVAGVPRHTQDIAGANPVVSGTSLDPAGAVHGSTRPVQGYSGTTEGQLVTQDLSYVNPDRHGSSKVKRRDHNASSPHG